MPELYLRIIMKYYIYGLIVSLILGLSGCGGEEEKKVESLNVNEAGTQTQTQILSLNGTFVDAVVEGLGYRCNQGTQNYTNSVGTFTCAEGENVQFNIGGLILPTITAQEAVISPYSLFPNDNEKALNLAQLLQSINESSEANHILINRQLENLIPSSIDLGSTSFVVELEGALGISLKDIVRVKQDLDTNLRELGIDVPSEVNKNHTPVANAGDDKKVKLGTLVELSALESSDGDNDELTYIWTLTSPNTSESVLDNANTVTPSFTADINGVYIASLVVNDGQVSSLLNSISIRVTSEVNQVPKANAGEDNELTAGSVVQLSGLESTDADNDELRYAWTLIVPSGSTSTLDNGSIATPRFTPDIDGIYLAGLVVNDGKDSSLSDSVSIVISSSETQTKVYLDPINGNINNNGSINSPLSSLSSVMASNKTFNDNVYLVLREGNHGKVVINGLNPRTQLSFVAFENEKPVLSELQIRNSSKLSFKDIIIDGSLSNLMRDNFMLTGDKNSHSLSFDTMIIKAADDSSRWTKVDWYANSIGGMDMRGKDITVTNSLITNVYHAVSLRGDRAYYAHNIIDNFAGDGIRGLGDDSIYEYNTVRDCYIDDYSIQHDDGFQAYRIASDASYKVKNVVLRGNKILLFADPITDFVRDNNLVGKLMQGMIITDGHADSWLVENNLVVSSQYHGISLYGATSCRVQNNTVVSHPSFAKNTAPRIYLDDQKKSGQTHSNTNNIVRNNITTTLTTWTFDASSTIENNLDIVESNLMNFTNIFSDYEGLNFHLKSTSTAIDTGKNTDTSLLDNDELDRIYNTKVDKGAFEYRGN